MPRPTKVEGSPPMIAAVTAAAAVVLPIPISPRSNRSASSSATALRPALKASLNRSGLIAASVRRLAVGLPTPTSTACTVAPATLANADTVAFDASNAASIAPVTSVGYALTPSAATPWSAAKISAAGVSTMGEGVRCHAAKCTATSSSRPNAPAGRKMSSTRACVAARLSSSAEGAAATSATSPRVVGMSPITSAG